MAFKKAPDQAHEDTDKEIAKLEKEITKVYKQASREVEKKMKEFTANFEREDKKWQKQIKKGEASQSDYDAWKRMQVFKGQRFETIRNNTLDILTNANQKAMDIVNGKTKDVFANNANFTAYQMEHQTGAGFGFGIYDSSTVERLIEKKPDLLPQPKVDIPKDKQWNMRSFNNTITQSIIQGESIPNVARRLAIKLGEKNANAMSMHARTAITSAQNAGRQQRYEEAQAMGIELKKQWLATRDGRTRDLHAMLDGQEVPVDEKFKVQGYEIEYPGDPTAAPEMVYNCRCTMKSEIEKYPSRYRPLTDQDRRELTEKSYKEWLDIKPPVNLEYELPEAISMRFQAYEQTRDRIFNQANQPVQSQQAEAPIDSGYYKNIINELPKREDIKKHNDVVNFTQSIIDVYAKNGNIQYDNSVQVTNVRSKDRGFCRIDPKTSKDRLYYDQISISNYLGKLGVDEEMKTAFHETFHFALNGQKWDGGLGFGSVSSKWRAVEETMTEAAAQFMSKEYGLDLSRGVPSYESYLINNLPKLKQLEKYQECKTIEDFGRIAWIDRVEKNAGDSGSGVWLELYQEMSKVTLPDDYYSEYIQYAVDHKEEILPKIIYSFAGSADKYADQISREYDSCLEKATNGVKMGMNEPAIYNKAIAVAMKELGVK